MEHTPQPTNALSSLGSLIKAPFGVIKNVYKSTRDVVKEVVKAPYHLLTDPIRHTASPYLHQPIEMAKAQGEVLKEYANSPFAFIKAFRDGIKGVFNIPATAIGMTRARRAKRAAQAAGHDAHAAEAHGHAAAAGHDAGHAEKPAKAAKGHDKGHDDHAKGHGGGHDDHAKGHDAHAGGH